MISQHELPPRPRPRRRATALLAAALVTALLAGCGGPDAESNQQSAATGPEAGQGPLTSGSEVEVTEVLERFERAGVPCRSPQPGVTAVDSLPGVRCSIERRAFSIAVFNDLPQRDRFITGIRAGMAEQQSFVVQGEDWADSVNNDRTFADRIATALDGRVLEGGFLLR